MYKRILCLLCAMALIMLSACAAGDEATTETDPTEPVTVTETTIAMNDNASEAIIASDATSEEESDGSFSVSAEEGVQGDGAENSAESKVDESDPLSMTVSEGVIGYSPANQTQLTDSEGAARSTAPEIGYYPFEIQYQTHNGSPVIIKSFKVPAGISPEDLVEGDFKEDDYIYSRRDVLMKESEEETDTKTVYEEIQFATENNEQATLLASLAPVIDYNEGGYSGQLVLDYSSIISSVAGETSYSYPIRRVVEVKP